MLLATFIIQAGNSVMLKNAFFIAVLLFFYGCSSISKDASDQDNLSQKNAITESKSYQGILK